MAWKTAHDRLEMMKASMKIARTETIVEDLGQAIAETEADMEDMRKTKEACICVSGKPYMPATLIKIAGVATAYFALYYIDVLLGGVLLTL